MIDFAKLETDPAARARVLSLLVRATAATAIVIIVSTGWLVYMMS